MWTDLEVKNGPKGSKEEMSSKKSDISPKKPKKRSNSKWIIFILIAIICLIIWHFSQNNNKTNNNVPSTTITSESKNLEEPVIIEPNSERTRTLSTGLHSFEMKAGEETSWLKLPTNRIVAYQIGSPGDEWLIEYSDGTTLKGSENPVLPTKEKVVFKIKSLKKQTVNIKID